MNQKRVRNAKYLLGLAVIGVALSGAAQPARATARRLMNGNATVTLNAFCPAGAAAPTRTITLVGPNPIVQLGPRLAAPCNRNTQIRAVVNGNNIQVTDGAAGGDAVSWDGLDLMSLVTPTSEEAFGSLNLEWTVSSSSVDFFGSWTASDAGVARRLSWYDVTDLEAPLLLDQLDLLGSVSSGGSINVTVPIPASGLDNLEVVADGIVVSTPEPGTVALLIAGALPVLSRRLRRRA